MKECIITKRINCPHESILVGEFCSECKIPDEIMTIKWSLGFKDRGHGHGDFAIILEDGTLLIKCPYKEIAEYVINLHNKSL